MPSSRRDVIRSAGAASLAAAAGSTERALAQPTPGSGIRTVRTDVLEIAYEAHGPAEGVAVILLHGFRFQAFHQRCRYLIRNGGKKYQPVGRKSRCQNRQGKYEAPQPHDPGCR